MCCLTVVVCFQISRRFYCPNGTYYEAENCSLWNISYLSDQCFAHWGVRPRPDARALGPSSQQGHVLEGVRPQGVQGDEHERGLVRLAGEDRQGLVIVKMRDLGDFVITDIGMRMLTPREQFAAQGFGPNYVIDAGADGRPIKKVDQTRLCGNSVSPPPATALIRANCDHLIEKLKTGEVRV